MTGVSARALAALLDTAVAQGLPLETLTEGLKEASLKSRRVDWEVIAIVCDRIGALFEEPADLIEFGETLAPGKSLSIFRAIGLTVVKPRNLYNLGAKWLGPNVFPMIEAEIHEQPDGLFVQRLTLQDGHRQCDSFFYVMAGFLRAVPAQWGIRPSDVEIVLEKRGATLFIRPDTTQIGLRSRMRRWLTRRASSRSLVEELAGQRTDIHAHYREARRTRDRIAAQARELEQVNEIGRELSQHIQLDHVAGVLTRVLLQDLSFTGVRLRLSIPTSPAAWNGGADESAETVLPPFVQVAGDLSGAPRKIFELKAASGPIGTLTVWSDQLHAETQTPTQTRGNGIPLSPSAVELNMTRDSVIERLIPWISMALDNARTYRRLESHAADLQSRVLERAARLLTANHHLVREIEERKQATDALLVTESQLRASERMASIGTLAAGIAHEINNPVGSILAAAQLALIVQSDEDAGPQVTDSLTDIVIEAKRCGEIVRSVLQFSRDERTEKWDCRLQDIVRRATRLTDPYTAEFGAQVDCSLPEPPVWVHVNPIQIEQALVNLVRNAIEAKGRAIQIVMEVMESENLTTIEVRDDGSGLSDYDQVRVFEPFYTTKQSDGGTGLGLSVVHGIVKEHGGTLKASPNPNGGATVLIELPALPNPPHKRERASDESESERHPYSRRGL